MKLFGRSSGYYLFWTAFVYFWIGIYLAFTNASHAEYASLGYVLALSVPLWCPPVARYFNMEPLMFDFFRFKKNVENQESSNVVKFPETKETPKMPYVVPPPKEEPAKIFYRLGLTDNNRVALSMGYSEITMNREGVENLIKQLQVFRDQLHEDNEE